MNTKVEEALGVIASGVANRDVRIAWPGQSIAELDNAGKTLARHIAQQDDALEREQGVREDAQRQLAERDATIARMREALDRVEKLSQEWKDESRGKQLIAALGEKK